MTFRIRQLKLLALAALALNFTTAGFCESAAVVVKPDTAATAPGAATTAPAAVQLEDHFFDSGGVQIHYFVKGEGEPVLLIHGFSASAQMNWIGPKVFDKLATEYQVIALDNRGHGKSGKPHEPGSYGVKMMEDSIALLDHLGIKKAHIVGYSMGGFITLKLISAHPDRVLSATIGGAGWSEPNSDRMKVLDTLADSLEQGKGMGPLINFLTPAGRPPMTQQQLDSMNKMMSLANDTKALAQIARQNKELTLSEDELKAIKVPVLGIVGGIDPLKETTDNLKGRVKDLRSITIEGADHMNAFGRPEFLDGVKAFIADHKQ